LTQLRKLFNIFKYCLMPSLSIFGTRGGFHFKFQSLIWFCLFGKCLKWILGPTHSYSNHQLQRAVATAPAAVVPKPLPPRFRLSPTCASPALSPPPCERCLRALCHRYAGMPSKTVISCNRQRPHAPSRSYRFRANTRLDSPPSVVSHLLLLPLR
jgi:hypothetical protein